jgi:uncharacterized RDD family membrane protein YckC
MENLDQILDVPPSVETRVEYAGFWIRFAALIIDRIILFVMQLIVNLMFGKDAPVLVVISWMVLGLIYYSVMESSQYQATIGKLAVGIKVGDREGEQLTWPNAAGRYLGKIISGITFCIGYMMAGWDEKNQALHDKMADTFVFYKR